MTEKHYIRTAWHDWQEISKEMYRRVENTIYPNMTVSHNGYINGFKSDLIEGKIEFTPDTPEYEKSLKSMWGFEFPEGFLTLLSNINLSCTQAGGELHSRQTIAALWEIYNWLTKGCIVDMMTGMKHDELSKVDNDA